jgi:hypothetical protein
MRRGDGVQVSRQLKLTRAEVEQSKQKSRVTIMLLGRDSGARGRTFPSRPLYSSSFATGLVRYVASGYVEIQRALSSALQCTLYCRHKTVIQRLRPEQRARDRDGLRQHCSGGAQPSAPHKRLRCTTHSCRQQCDARVSSSGGHCCNSSEVDPPGGLRTPATGWSRSSLHTHSSFPPNDLPH